MNNTENLINLIKSNKAYLQNAVIFDIGSNIGMFSKLIIDQEIPYEEIHLFEPCKEYLELSKKELKDNRNVYFNNFALGSKKENKIIYKSKENIGWNTLLKVDPKQNNEFFKDMNTEEISIVKLDDLDVKKLDFLKIDVEGYEAEVINGAFNTISEFKPYILVEVGWGKYHPNYEQNLKIYENLFKIGYKEVDLDLEDTKDILFEPEFRKLPLSIGILSWKNHKTLENTLNSYQKNGLFDICEDVQIFFQEYDELDLSIANKFNIPSICSDENIGIGKAFEILTKNAKNSNILLLENDWELIENRNQTYDRLFKSLNLLEDGFSCVRLRHRREHGYPLYSKNVYENNELNFFDTVTKLYSPHLLDCIHWKENPDKDFPDKIQKCGDFFISNSRWSNWTNNPCVYKKEFYLNCIVNYTGIGIELEENISSWWANQKFLVAQGEGLFKHNDLNKNIRNPMKIIDCFPYFNEKELLELRINLLYDKVDKFYVLEMNKTHSGEFKEFTAAEVLNELNIPLDKVEIIQIELPDDTDKIYNEIDEKNVQKNEFINENENIEKYLNHWARERLQRDAILSFIDNFDDDTVFFITDCDEIINPSYIEYISSMVMNNPESLVKLPLVFLEARANLRVYHPNGNPVQWDSSSFACLKSHLKKSTPTELRCNISNYYTPNYILENGNRLEDLGWHFSWMGDSERRILKCRSFLHSNTFNNEENLKFLETYTPEIGKVDPLNRQDHILREYPLELLPKKIFELPNVKQFLLGDDVKLDSFEIPKDFDWGNNPKEMPGIIGPEIFLNRIYEKIVVVEDGDIVVDIGANVGAFGHSIKDRNVKMIYCVEPSNGLVDTLVKNLEGMPITIINKAISNDNNEYKQLIGSHNIYGNIGDRYSTITFKKLIEDYNIPYIDFLKIDCEGGEYEVFTEENRDYILNNVKNIAGEWHFLNESTVDRFKNFRNLYLKGYEYKVFDRYDNDVSEKILDDQYLVDYEKYHRGTLDGQFMVYISYDAPVQNENTSKTFTFYSNPKPALWIVDNFYDDPYAIREFALKQDYLQGGLGKGFIGKRSCEQFLFPGLKEAFQKITGIPITVWEEHGMNGRFQSTIAGEPNVYHADSQTWAGAIYLTPDAPYNAGTSLLAHKSTRIRHSSHPESNKMWSDPNTHDIHLDPLPWERIDVAANVFNRLVIWNAHCPHAAGEYFGDTLNTSRLIHLFFFD